MRVKKIYGKPIKSIGMNNQLKRPQNCQMN